MAEFIARSIKSNIRELKGALIRLMAYASLTGMEINLSTAQQVLKNVIETQEKKMTIEQIQKCVGEHFGLRTPDLKVRSNSKVIAFPRASCDVSREAAHPQLRCRKSGSNLAASTTPRCCTRSTKLRGFVKSIKI